MPSSSRPSSSHPVPMWSAAFDAAWYEVDSSESVEKRAREMDSWPSFSLSSEEEAKVLVAMAHCTSLHSQFVAYRVLETLNNRGQPLHSHERLPEKSKKNPTGFPEWLVRNHWKIVFEEPSWKNDRPAMDRYRLRLMMSNVSISALRQEVRDAESSGTPILSCAPLPAAIAAGLRNSLAKSKLRRDADNPLNVNWKRDAEIRAHRFMGVLRWVSSDLTGIERQSALLLCWATAVWMRHNYENPLFRHHFDAVAERANSLLEKSGVHTLAQRIDAARWALSGHWGRPLTVLAAETLATSWGADWPTGSESIWAESLAVLSQCLDSHWYVGRGTIDETVRHLLRDGIGAAISHLECPLDTLAPLALIDALTGALPPARITELLGQIWCSAHRVGIEQQELWQEVVEMWLHMAPSEEVDYWPVAVAAAWRSEDGLRNELVAKAAAAAMSIRVPENPSPSPRRPRIRF